MKNILVVFTGGTIGSRASDSIINIDDNAKYYLLDQAKKHIDYQFSVETIQPLNILSENTTPKHWQQLVCALMDIDRKKYDGIIITHGSDTLPYVSALISYAFRNTNIPIVLTASNYALNDTRSNGVNNFVNSIHFIHNNNSPGVFVVYENNKNEPIVYIGSRLMEADPYNDQYKSFEDGCFGKIIDNKFIINTNDKNPSISELGQINDSYISKDISFDNEIIAIRPFPGLNYNYFQFNQSKPKAILHSLYHSATGCIQSGSYSLPQFIRRCRENDIDFYLTSFKDVNKELYITSRELLDNGAIALENIAFESAVAKLWIAYNQTTIEPRKFMEQEIYFEIL